MANNRDKIIFKKTIKTTPEHRDQAAEELLEEIRKAPKPNEHRAKLVMINHKIECSDNTITLGGDFNEESIHKLLKQHGLWQEDLDPDSHLSNKKENTSFNSFSPSKKT